jgi:hypothetical protein
MWAWISTPSFTIRVELDPGFFIIEAAPVVKWSKRKHVIDLVRWCERRFKKENVIFYVLED